MQVLITLGSNINREQNIDEALAQLEQQPDLHILAVSPVYVTQAVGADGSGSAQPAFSTPAASLPGCFGALLVGLVAGQPRTERLGDQEVVEAQNQVRFQAAQRRPVVVQYVLQQVEAEEFLLVFIEGAHDARHVDALLVRLQRDCAGDRGLQQQRFARAAGVAQRPAGIVDAGLPARHRAGLGQGSRAVL